MALFRFFGLPPPPLPPAPMTSSHDFFATSVQGRLPRASIEPSGPFWDALLRALFLFESDGFLVVLVVFFSRKKGFLEGTCDSMLLEGRQLRVPPVDHVLPIELIVVNLYDMI